MSSKTETMGVSENSDMAELFKSGDEVAVIVHPTAMKVLRDVGRAKAGG